MYRLLLITALLLIFEPSGAHHRQFSKDDRSSSRYSFTKDHHPQSTGKSYMDRQIAEVMGPAGIPWLDRPQRQKEEDIQALIAKLPIKKGHKIADIGAGSGRLSFLMAERVGKKGKIYAIDIQKEMLEKITQKRKRNMQSQVVTVLGSLKSTKLKPNSIDGALMVDVYHEFSYPYEMLLSISKNLKPGGFLALVEYKGEDPKVPIKELHKMTIHQIKREFSMKEFGLNLHSIDSKLPRQHLVVFRKG